MIQFTQTNQIIKFSQDEKWQTRVNKENGWISDPDGWKTQIKLGQEY